MDLIDLAEAARILGVSTQTLRNYIREGKLHEFRQGRKFLVSRSEVNNLVLGPARPRADAGPHVLAIANQKGGVGKTTTTWALGALLAEEAPTLLIDMDAQANLTQAFGINEDKVEYTLADVLVDPDSAPASVPIERTILPVGPPPSSLFLIPANLRLSLLSTKLFGMMGWESLLRDALTPVLSSYRYILIDCPPNLDPLTINALMASTEVLVPIDAGAFSLTGILILMDVVARVRRRNAALQKPYILSCRAESNQLSDRILSDLWRTPGIQPLHTVIRKTAALGKAQYVGRALHLDQPNSAAAKDYQALAQELFHGR